MLWDFKNHAQLHGEQSFCRQIDFMEQCLSVGDSGQTWSTAKYQALHEGHEILTLKVSTFWDARKGVTCSF